MHSFVLDALDTTGADTFSHFEMLIDEHRNNNNNKSNDRPVGGGISGESSDGPPPPSRASSHTTPPNGTIAQPPSRLKRLVPGIGTFYTRLPLRKAFEAYNAKYGITKRQYLASRREP